MQRIIFVALAAIFQTLLMAPHFENFANAKEYCDEFFCLRTIQTKNSVQFTATNSHKYLPVSTSIALTLSNMKVDQKPPHRFTVKPGETRTLFTASARSKGRWQFKFKYYWRYGDHLARHDNTARYQLPVEPGSKVKITQGCNQEFSHKGKRGYATDFAMKVGTPIHAARAGVVVAIREDSDSGGKTIEFAKQANYIYIQHEDGTIGTYLHLKKDGVEVELGQRIEAAQLIGYSGNTGWSTFPHLHFEVVKPQNSHKLEWESQKFTYQTADGTYACPNDIELRARP